MNAIPEGILVNSCQYTPVYLVQDPGDPQGRSYYLTQANIEEPKPVSDNLKTFYESSGNIENSVINANNYHRPRIVKKQENCNVGVVGNNLKLASFLLPKNENVNKQQYVVNNVVTKSTVTINHSNCSTSTVNTVPRLNIDSKIVKLNNLELKTKYKRVGSAPKTKPKEPTHNVLTSAPTNLTSIQLLKLGETYHCLDQLNEEQMSQVTQALKIFSNPEKIAAETTYDPVTNTKYLYKVVSTKDVAVVGNKLVPMNKIYEAKVDNTYNEQKDKLPRETVKKDLFHKENKRGILKAEHRKALLKTDSRKDLAKTDLRKGLVKTEFRKEFVKSDVLVKSDLRKDMLPKNDLNKDIFVKTDSRKDVLAKSDFRKEMLAKNDLRKDVLIKNELRKDLIGKNDCKKDFMARDDMKKDSLTKNDMKKDLSVNKSDLRKETLTKIDISNKTDFKKETPIKNGVKKEPLKRNEEKMKQKVIKEDTDDEEMEEVEVETKVTRSGRKVKLPKLNLPEDAPHKPKKKTTFIACFQCPAVFSSLYRLQKHYEAHPTHIPSKIHSNLFHCLLAIVKSGSEEDRTNIFIQQLEQLIVKLKSLLPCLLKNSDSIGKPCTISNDIGRLLGMEPGKYNFDIDALNCVKNKDGYCLHKPPPKEVNTESINQSWDSVIEDLNCEANTEDCARINSVEKWPTVNKRVWKQKQQKENAKRMRLASENGDLIELGVEDMVIVNNTNCSNDYSAILSPQGAENKADTHLVDNKECNEFIEPVLSLPEEINLHCVSEPEPPAMLQATPSPNYLSSDTDNLLNPEPPNLLNTDTNDSLQPSVPPKSTNHLQFHSTHFDIRSSPIKPSSTVFRKFQINTELLAKYEDSMRSIETVDNVQENEREIQTQIEVPQNTLNTDETLQEIFRDEDLSVVKESFTLDRELKDWILNRSNDEKSEDGFCKTNSIIEPALLHIKDHENKTTNDTEPKDVLSTSDNHDESSVLNFLDSLDNCLSYPGTEIRTNNGDFQLDLFSFTSS